MNRAELIELAFDKKQAIALQEARSDSDVRALLQTAIRRDMGSSYYGYVLYVWPNSGKSGTVVHSAPEGMAYSRSYELKKNDTGSYAVLGDKTLGYLSAQFEPAATSSAVSDTPVSMNENMRELGTLECVESEDTKREVSKIRVRLIAPGWGASAYYPADVLRRDGPSVFKKGTHMFWNHDTQIEEAQREVGDLDRLAGVLTEDAKWENDGLYAFAEVKQRFKKSLADLWKDIGVSIRAYGAYSIGTREERTGKIAEKLIAGRSVDFVTRAGAGGKIVQLFESAARGEYTSLMESEERMDQETQKRFEQLESQLRSMTDKFTEGATQMSALMRTMQESAASTAALNGRALYMQIIEQSKLPEQSKRRLQALQFAPVIKDGVLSVEATQEAAQTMVSQEAAYIKSLGVPESKTVIGGMEEAGSGENVEKSVEDIVAKLNAVGKK